MLSVIHTSIMLMGAHGSPIGSATEPTCRDESRSLHRNEDKENIYLRLLIKGAQNDKVKVTITDDSVRGA